MSKEAVRVIAPFSVPDGSGSMRSLRVGDVLDAGDPATKGNDLYLQPLSEYIAQSTVAPGDGRPVRMPSGVTNDEATKARDVRDGPRTKGKAAVMPHALPPEHEDSPASTFAPFQPAAGVQADDAVEKGQSPEGALKASEANKKFAGKELDTSPGHTGEAQAPVVDEDAGKPAKGARAPKPDA
jgi:hypothetical protein